MTKRTHDSESIEDGPDAKKPRASSDGAPTITKEEADLYDRQIRLWGMEAQQRMRQAKILVCGISGLSNEICKNLVLAGVGALTIMDNGTVTEEDLGAQFFLRQEDVGKNRAETAAPRIQALNPRVDLKAVSAAVEEQADTFFAQFDIVCLCNSELKTMIRIDELCRARGTKFYSAGTAGLLGYIFCDLKEHTFVEERKSTDKDDPKIEKVEKLVVFPSLRETIEIKWDSPDLQQMTRRRLHAFRNESDRVYFAFNLLWRFVEENRRFPSSDSPSDAEKLVSMKCAYLESVECDPSYVPDRLIRKGRTLAETATSEITPVCAILGGFAAQDILKVLSGKDSPINNYFCFDGNEFSGKLIRAPPAYLTKAKVISAEPQETIELD